MCRSFLFSKIVYKKWMTTDKNRPPRRTVNIPYFSKEEYKQGFVTFIDILGFSDFVSQTSFEKVLSLFSSFEDRIKEGELHITADEEELIKANNGEPWKIRTISHTPALSVVSDTIVIFTPENVFPPMPPDFLDDIDEEKRELLQNIPIIQMLALSAVHIQVKLLGHGLLSRGAITYGPLYQRGSVLFGPAIVDAYRIEKSETYPRIVFSEAVSVRLGLEHAHANSIIKKGDDGLYYCDYLGMLHAGSATSYEEALKETSLAVSRQIEKISGEDGDTSRKIEKWQWLASRLKEKETLTSSR